MQAEKTVGSGVGSATHQIQPVNQGYNEYPDKVPSGFTSFNPYRQVSHNFLVPVDLAERGISSRAQLVYGLLRKYAGQNGRCFVGRVRMAKELNCTVRTIARALSELIEKKLIVRYTKELGGKAFTMFLKPDDPGDMDDTGVGSVVSLPGVKNVPTPVTGMTLPGVKNVLLRGLDKEVQEKEEKECVFGARSACAKSHFPLPEQNCDEPGLGNAEADEEKAFRAEILTLLCDDKPQEHLDLFLSIYPKMIHPEKTKAALLEFLKNANAGDRIYAHMVTESYARSVKPLLFCPSAWVYVIGSETWFSERRWLWQTPEQLHAWAKSKGKEHGIPALESAA